MTMSVLDQYVQIAEEAAYGTFQAPTRAYEADTASWQALATLYEYGGLRAGRHAGLTDRQRRIAQGGTGRISSPVLTKGEGLRLKHLLGAATAPAQDGSTAAYDQTFRTTALGPIGSYTVQALLADSGGTLRPFSFLGCVPTDFSISVDTGSHLNLDVGYFATNVVTSGVATPAAAYPAGAEMLLWADTSIGIAGAAVEYVTGFSLNVDLAMATDRYGLRNDETPRQPKRRGQPTITGSLSGEFENLADFERYVAGAPFSISLTAQHPTAIEAAKYPTFSVLMQNCRYSAADPSGTPDALSTQELPFSVTYDGTNAAVAIDYKSADTAV